MQLDDNEIEAYVNEVWEDVVKNISRLVSINSVEDLSQAEPGKPWGPASYAALTEALAIAAELGLDAHDCEGYIGYADVAGDSKEYLAMIAHTDIVPAGKGWTGDPFTVERKEGYLIGRGVLDDKGPFVLSLYAAHFFKRWCEEKGQTLPYTLRCLVGNAEETTMDDVKWYLKHYPEPLFAFTPDADFPLICGEKGVFHARVVSSAVLDPAKDVLISLEGGTVINAICGQAEALVHANIADLPVCEGFTFEALDTGVVKIKAQGIGGHASLPEGTKNALGMMASYLLEHDLYSPAQKSFLELQKLICALGWKGEALGIASHDEVFGPLTCIGGTAYVEDGHLVQTIDIRYPTSITKDELIEKLTACAHDHHAAFELLGNKDPFYIDPATPEIKTLLNTYEHFTGNPAQAQVIGGGTYARNFKRACAFGPHDTTETVPSWVGMEHGPDEGVSEQSLKTALKIYISSLAQLMDLSYTPAV